ncbi:DUF6781 family protein [Streptomyces sp. NPDC018031]|uniref:DUF6781 family protein n=1 Tax=Streptomyces sp. NPDC018031 TaxID=3365033 RepID=UPI003788DEE0
MTRTPQDDGDTPTPAELREQAAATREQLEGTVEPATADAKDRVREKAAQVGDRLKETAAQTGDQVRQTAAQMVRQAQEKAPEPVVEGAEKAASAVRRGRGPLLVAGVVGLVVLVAVGRARRNG